MPKDLLVKIGIGVIVGFALFKCVKDGGFDSNSRHYVTITTASYDLPREYFQEFNNFFEKYWHKTHRQKIKVKHYFGNSVRQAEAIMDGVIEADIAALASANDIDTIAYQSKLLPTYWRMRHLNASAPATSTVIFVVRKGNPKQVANWMDLLRSNVSIVTTDPRVSGEGQWIFLAAWGYALRMSGDNETWATEFATQLYRNVIILNSSARGATATFLNGTGDVLLTWESEARLMLSQTDERQYELIYPSASIIVMPPIAPIDRNLEKHKTQALVKAYFEQLYSKEGQKIAIRNYYRPYDKELLAENADRFPHLELYKFDDYFSNWRDVTMKFFKENGIFDQLYTPQLSPGDGTQ